MTQNAVSGYASYANYGYETTYGTVTTAPRCFGHGLSITHDRKNNMEKITGLGSRNGTATVAKKYEGTADVEFTLSNGSFFRAVLGTVTDGTVGSVYTHTYAEANTVPSFTILTATELGTNDEVTALIGCKVASMTLTCAVGEAVKVRLNCPYITETLATSGIGTVVAETESPFTFAHGTLSVGGSTVADVQSVEVSLNNTLEGIWGLGSRLKTTDVEKIRDYNFTFNVVFKNVATLLQTFLGASGAPATGTPTSVACVLTFTNGLATSDTGARSVVMTFANLYLDTEKLPKNVNDVIKEDVTGWALSCTSVVYTNFTASDDDTP